MFSETLHCMRSLVHPRKFLMYPRFLKVDVLVKHKHQNKKYPLPPNEPSISNLISLKKILVYFLLRTLETDFVSLCLFSRGTLTSFVQWNARWESHCRILLKKGDWSSTWSGERERMSLWSQKTPNPLWISGLNEKLKPFISKTLQKCVGSLLRQDKERKAK